MSSAALARQARPAVAPPSTLFVPMPPFVAEASDYVDVEPDVSSGFAQARCIKLVFKNTLSLPRKRRKNEKNQSLVRTLTPPLHSEDYAKFYAGRRMVTDADRRTVQSVLDEGLKRQVFFRRQATREDFIDNDMKPPLSLRGWYVYWLPTDWKAVRPYETPKKPAASAEALDAAEEAGEEQDTIALVKGQEHASVDRRRERIHLTPEPLKVIAGQPSKAYPVPVPPEKVRYRTNHPLLEFDSIFYRGELIIDVVDPALAKKKRITEVHFGSQNGHAANTELSAAIAARGAPMAEAQAGRAMDPADDRWRRELNSLFAYMPHPIDDSMLRRVREAAGVATLDQIENGLREKARRKAYDSWGGVLGKVGEIGRSWADKARAVSNDTRRHVDPGAAERQRNFNRDAYREALRAGPDDKAAAAVLQHAELTDPEVLAEAKAEAARLKT